MQINLFLTRLLVVIGVALSLATHASTPNAQAAAYSAQAGAPVQASLVQQFFTAKHGKDWSCASCHTVNPTAAGKHASTGKPIGAMAPSVNPERFTDQAKTEKWFRRNCNDVIGRECTTLEKADVLAWLLTFQH